MTEKKFWTAIEEGNVPLLAGLASALHVASMRNGQGLSPLLEAIAVSPQNYDVVRVLLTVGADPNAPDPATGKTPLHVASIRQDPVLVQLLVAGKADVHARDAHGNTPLFDAVFRSQGHPEVVEMLLKAGADERSTNKHGVSPYDLAKRCGFVKILASMCD
ncbi:MAG: ankyrin repeat domain-containing protein [Phycisphaerales bacterium]|jgi:ankyrin repeat protein